MSDGCYSEILGLSWRRVRKHLVEERREQGKSQFEMSEILGVSRRHYQNIELGISDGSLEFWLRASEISGGKSINYLCWSEMSCVKYRRACRDSRRY